MLVQEIKFEELSERIENKNAIVIGKYLEGSLKPSDESIIRRLRNEKQINTHQT